MMHLSDRRFTHHEGAGESFCVFRRSQRLPSNPWSIEPIQTEGAEFIRADYPHGAMVNQPWLFFA
jgi:hypothetical protein